MASGPPLVVAAGPGKRLQLRSNHSVQTLRCTPYERRRSRHSTAERDTRAELQQDLLLCFGKMWLQAGTLLHARSAAQCRWTCIVVFWCSTVNAECGLLWIVVAVEIFRLSYHTIACFSYSCGAATHSTHVRQCLWFSASRDLTRLRLDAYMLAAVSATASASY
jgi:hypothetical protein